MGGELGINVGPDTTSISSEVLSERGPDAVRLIAEVAEHPRLPESELERVKGYTYSPFSALDPHPGEADWVETADVTTNVTGESLKEIFFET